MRELARHGERAVLEPPGLPRTGTAAVERMSLELVDCRAPELPPPTTGAGQKVIAREGAMRAGHGTGALELVELPHRMRGDDGDEDETGDRDDQRDSDHT